MATISACAVGSLTRVTWLVPVAITPPSLTTRAANGPPSRRTQTTAISMACLMNELDIRPGPITQDGQGCHEFPAKSAGNSWQSCLSLGFDQSRADGIPHHAGGLMHSQLLQDPAAMRVGGLVADTQLDRGFLGGFPAGNQH